MSQNILITVLTVLFYLSSILGSGEMTSPNNQYSQTPNQKSSVAGKQGEIIGDRVTVRSGPGTDYSAITTVEKDSQVTLLDIENGWYKANLESGRNGWIAGYLIDVISSSNSTIRDNDKLVLGYMLGSESQRSLIENSNYLTSISPWSWNINSYGELNSDFDSDQLAAALQFAGNSGLDTYALIHNFYNDRFDKRVVSSMLNSELAQTRAINQIKNKLTDWGMSGINLDLENVLAKDRDALTNFVAKLSEELRAHNLKVTMAVPAKTTDNRESDFSGAYDYAKLGKHVDHLVIMAYDQHYRNGGPGPVASVKWVEEVLEYATNQVENEKIVLGIPGYGYDWPNQGSATGRTYNQSMQIAAEEGVSIRWHSEHKVPYFEYGSGRKIWFENRYSIRYKIDLANKYNLGGIALWRLGQEDPGIWHIIAQNLN